MAGMFAHSMLTAKIYAGQNIRFLHEKHDGHRVIFYRQDDSFRSPVLAMTRSQTDLWPKLFSRAKKHGMWKWVHAMLQLPARSSVDAELVLPGYPASAIKTAIADCNPNLAIQAFAVPMWAGEKEFDRPLQWAMDKCTAAGIPFASFIDTQECKPVDPDEYMLKCPAEIEGYVAKQSNYLAWYKIKRVKTIDAFVTGFDEGNGKYTGMLGALRCSVFDANGNECEICACSGMTDDYRVDIWANRKNLLGRVCEIKYQLAGAAGRLRHPIFVQWRDDKLQAECNVGQDVDLLRYWRKARC